jgi:hypothetical protein
MTSEDGDSVVASPHLFRLDDDDDEYEDLLGTQFPNDNPDLPLLDLDEDFTPRAAEPSAQPLRRRRPRVSIPDNAEIIDLDGFEICSGPHNLPQAFIKAEDRDVVLPSVEKPATIKTEEPETDFLWQVMPDQYINLVDHDEEPQIGTKLSTIKQESEEEWTWTEMQREVIELSDSEDETLANAFPKATTAERPNQVELPDQSALSGLTPASAPSGSMLRSNIKTKRIPGDHDKLLQIQKLYAERALGKAVIAGAGGIFKGPQGSAATASAAKSAANIPEDELAWMNSTVDPNEDADTAKEFAESKARYNRKKRAGRNTFEDDIFFMKAESAEKARLKRLDDDYHRARGPVYECVPLLPCYYYN